MGLFNWHVSCFLLRGCVPPALYMVLNIGSQTNIHTEYLWFGPYGWFSVTFSFLNPSVCIVHQRILLQ